MTDRSALAIGKYQEGEVDDLGAVVLRSESNSPIAEGKGHMVTTTKLSAVDADALSRALAIEQASDEPGRREQDRDWFEAARSANTICARCRSLRPHQSNTAG